jgi:hypothetical protein
MEVQIPVFEHPIRLYPPLLLQSKIRDMKAKLAAFTEVLTKQVGDGRHLTAGPTLQSAVAYLPSAHMDLQSRAMPVCGTIRMNVRAEP